MNFVQLHSELVCVCSRIHGFGFHWCALNVPLKRMSVSSCWGGYYYYCSWRSLVYSYLKQTFLSYLFFWDRFWFYLFIYCKDFFTYIFIIFPFTSFSPVLCTSLPTHYCSPQVLSYFLSPNCKSISMFSVHHKPVSWFLALPGLVLRRSEKMPVVHSPFRSTLHLASALCLPATAHFAASGGCSQIWRCCFHGEATSTSSVNEEAWQQTSAPTPHTLPWPASVFYPKTLRMAAQWTHGSSYTARVITKPFVWPRKKQNLFPGMNFWGEFTAWDGFTWEQIDTLMEIIYSVKERGKLPMSFLYTPRSSHSWNQ